MATKTAKDALDNINSYLEEIGGLSKQAASNTEAGSIGGATTHPVKDVDDNTRPATEGSRSSENTEDVKEEVPASVDATPEAKAAALRKKAEGTAASDHLQIGMKVAPTGEDSSVETASAKAGKEDGGYKGPSKHPARTDNNELDGRKYAEAIDGASLEKLAEMLGDLGNDICGQIAFEYKGKQAATEAPAPAAQAAPVVAAPAGKQASNADLAAQVGWELAGLIDNTMDKQAAEVMVTQALEGIIKEAEDDADRVIDYLNSYFAQKRAMDEGAADAEPAPEAPGAGGPGGDPAGPTGGPPMGDPAGDPAAGGPGGGDGLAELGAILEQLGISPEELISALTAQGGGDGGGMPPGGDPAGGMPPGGDPAAMGAAAAGGAPPMAPPAAPPMAPPGGGMEVAASAKTAAAATRAQKQAEMRNFILETVTRSRKK